jgi:hypothetical protein
VKQAAHHRSENHRDDHPNDTFTYTDIRFHNLLSKYRSNNNFDRYIKSARLLLAER